MIDWYNLVVNAFWILGCAIALAAVAYASWEASALQDKFRIRLGQPHIQIFLNIGGLLFSLGLAGTSGVIWQQVLWILLALGFAIQIGVGIYKMKSAE